MPYTPTDIIQLKKLAYHHDMENVLLAFELIKGRGWQRDLTTILYWLHNRFLLEEATSSARETERYIRRHAPALALLDPLHDLIAATIPQLFERIYPRLQQSAINCAELATALHQLALPPEERVWLTPFLFRFGSVEVQEEVLPVLIRRQHTGVYSLDLSAQQLTAVPSSILSLELLQELNLDNNQLTLLPLHWERLTSLEVLHVAGNQLTHLPESLIQLQQLKRLYLQNNPWDLTALKLILQRLPALEHLSVSSEKEGTCHQLEALVQAGLLRAPAQEQRLFLAWELQDAEALAALTTLELFTGLRHEQDAVRTLAREQLLDRELTFNKDSLSTESSIAILGLVSFAARKRLEVLDAKGWKVTNEIVPQTTHLLLGDHPEQYEAVAERSFVFLSEADVFDL